MNNGDKIYWTTETLNYLNYILKFLEENWSAKEKSNFVLKLDKRIKLIAHYPELFPKSEKSKIVRRSVLTEHRTIFYLIKQNIIEVLSLFDVRQDSNKIKI